MIKRWKMIICSFCYKQELMEKVSDMHGSWWVLPAGWKEINRKTHFCPNCNDAIYSARDKIAISTGSLNVPISELTRRSNKTPNGD